MYWGVTEIWKVFEPEAIGDPNQGEASGDDDEALVAQGGAVRCLVLVCPTPLQHSLVEAENKGGW